MNYTITKLSSRSFFATDNNKAEIMTRSQFRDMIVMRFSSEVGVDGNSLRLGVRNAVQDTICE